MKTDNEETVISLRKLTKKFGHFVAVNDISLDIKKGEIVGFLGPNGAGKSTTMKMLARLLIPDEGEVWIKGNGHIQKLSKSNKDYLLDNIGFLIENPAFYGHMTPRQILSYFARLRGYPKKKINARVEEVVKMIGMEKWIDKKIGTFSKGMRQKIGIVSAIVHDPEIVVLDEPQTGLDPKARKEVRDFIRRLKALGKTVFISSHLLYEISEIADKIGIIFNGKLIAFDTLDNLEAASKRSILQVELSNMTNYKIDEIKTKLEKIVSPIIKIGTEKKIVRYNTDTDIFEIVFDGNTSTQALLFKAIASSDLPIVGISVPRTNLLEELYLDYISNGESINADITKKDDQMGIKAIIPPIGK